LNLADESGNVSHAYKTMDLSCETYSSLNTDGSVGWG
jgi:hypothetical protein